MKQTDKTPIVWTHLGELTLLLLILAQFAVGQLFQDRNIQIIVTDIFSLLICLISSGGLWLAYRYSQRSAIYTAQPWLFFSIAVVLFSTGDLIWSLLGINIYTGYTPSLADLFYILFYAAFFRGILIFPKQKDTLTETVKHILDFGIVVLSAGLIYWNLLIGSWNAASWDNSLLLLLFTLLYPILDLVLFSALHLLPARKENILPVSSKSFLIGGVTLFFITDTLFSYQNLLGGSVNEGIFTLSWMLGRALLGIAGFVQVNTILKNPENIPNRVPRPSIFPIRNWSQYLPYLWVMSIYILLIINYQPAYSLSHEVLTLGVGGIFLLVIARQIIIQQENIWLVHQLGNMNLHLEERIRQRTQEIEHAKLKLETEALARENALEALARSEAQFRTLVEQIPAVTYICPADNLTLPSYISPQIEKLLGISQKHWLEHKMTVNQHIHPNDLTAAIQKIELSFASGAPYRAEYRMVAQDGSIKWVVDQAVRVENAKDSSSWWQGLLLDVTIQTQTLERLRYQSALVENVSDAIISTDLQARVVSWNPAAEQIYGWKAEETIGLPLLEFTRPEEGSGLAEFGTSEQDEEYSKSTLHHHRQGAPLNILTSTTLIHDSYGQPVGTVIVNRDISAIKMGESLLARYEALFKQARDIILFVRVKDGQILEANLAAELEYGYSRAELLKLRIFDLRSSDTQGQIQNQMQQADSGGVLFESRHRRKDGSVFPVEVSSLGTDFNQQRCNLSIIRNISERKEAEKALRTAHELLEKTFASLDEVVIVQAPYNRTIIRINSACQRVLGYSPEELIGNTPECIYSSLSEYQLVGQQIQTALSETGIYQTEQTVRRKDGQLIIVEVLINEMKDAQNHRIGLVGSMHDITQRKEAESALRKSEASFKALFNNLNEGIGLLGYEISPGGTPEIHFLNANPAFQRLLGFSQVPLIGQKLQDVFPGDEKIWGERYQKVALLGESLEFQEYFSPADLTFDIRAFCPEPGRFGMLLVNITEQKRAEKKLREFADRLQALSRRLLEVQEEERRHLGRELHDEIGQVLTGLKFNLEASIEKMPENQNQGLSTALELVKDLIVQVRELSLRLRPAMLDDFGLVPALVWLCDRCRQYSDLDVLLEHAGLQTRLPLEIETGAYRITQEALTNVIRHAETKQAKVRIWIENDLLNLHITDTGKGFDLNTTIASAQSAGLSGILERASLLNGCILIESTPGSGTSISAQLPVAFHHPEEENDHNYAG